MKHLLRVIPVLMLAAALAACNDSDGSAENDDGEQTAGDGLNPTAIAAELAPPTGGRLPADLRPPS